MRWNNGNWSIGLKILRTIRFGYARTAKYNVRLDMCPTLYTPSSILYERRISHVSALALRSPILHPVTFCTKTFWLNKERPKLVISRIRLEKAEIHREISNRLIIYKLSENASLVNWECIHFSVDIILNRAIFFLLLFGLAGEYVGCGVNK